MGNIRYANDTPWITNLPKEAESMPLFKSICTWPKCVIPGVMQVQYSLFPSAIFPTSFCRLTLSAIYCATILHSHRVCFIQRSCQKRVWVNPAWDLDISDLRLQYSVRIRIWSFPPPQVDSNIQLIFYITLVSHFDLVHWMCLARLTSDVTCGSMIKSI